MRNFLVLFLAFGLNVIMAQPLSLVASQETNAIYKSHLVQDELSGHDHIVLVQRELNKRGANLEITGHLDDRTREEIKKFQTNNFMLGTGTLNLRTVDRLGLGFLQE